MEGLLFDLRYALRSLLRYPGFAAAVIATLALGIGANAALFTLAYPLVLRPLPYAEPERLVMVWETVRRDAVELRPFSYLQFSDLSRRASAFAGLAALSDDGVVLSGLERAERVRAELVTPEYFRVLGVEPALGRGLAPEDGDPETGAGAVVLGHGAARRLFPDQPVPLGRTLEVAGRTATVVGVMPEGFVGLSQEAELWLPLRSAPSRALESRASRWLSVVGRLAPGTDLARARDEVARVASQLEEEFPDENRRYGATVVPLREDLLGGLARPVVLLFGAVAFVLLIAGANVANLLLMRSVGRRREAALRRALGMSRARRLRLLLAEALLLSLAGAGLGLLLAVWGLEIFEAVNPVPLPPFVRLELSAPVLAFALLLAALTATVLAGVEALESGGAAAAEDLREGGRAGGAGRGSHHLRRALVVAEVALALVLAVGAGLMLRSLGALSRIDSKLRPGGVLVAGLDLPALPAEPEARALALDLLERVRTLPGVETAALSTDAPFDGNQSATLLRLEGQSEREGEPYHGLTRIYYHRVTPAFFDALGIALLAGRSFSPSATPEEERAVVVSEKLARRLWPGQDPLGRRLQLGSGAAPWLTVIGVAEDVRYRSLAPDPQTPEDPDLYLPLSLERDRTLALSVRSPLAPQALAASIRSRVEGLSRDIPLYGVASLEDQVSGQLGQARLTAVLLGLFAGLAAALAAVGIYSVLAFLVGQRTREIGVRIALGAGRASVLGLVARQGMLLAMGGLAVGLALALGLTRLLAAQLYGVTATDPSSFGVMAVALAGLALAACLLPARRAARVDPAVTLKAE
jgi:predicted permease